MKGPVYVKLSDINLKFHIVATFAIAGSQLNISTKSASTLQNCRPPNIHIRGCDGPSVFATRPEA